jgi:DNA-binding Xre family transcriptional regulator
MQKIVTPGGETLIVMPLEEYEQLLDAADIGAADRVRADIAAGRDELLPSEMVDRLLAGENPIRVWREHRAMSARELAARSGLSTPYVSQIETGKREGTIAVLRRIAEALSVTLEDLT